MHGIRFGPSPQNFHETYEGSGSFFKKARDKTGNISRPIFKNERVGGWVTHRPEIHTEFIRGLGVFD